jgi:hypothetical protein
LLETVEFRRVESLAFCLFCSILAGLEGKYWPENDGHTTDLSLETTEIRNGAVNNGRSAIVTTWSSVDVGASDSRPFLDHIHLPMRPNGGQLIETDILLTTRTEEAGKKASKTANNFTGEMDRKSSASWPPEDDFWLPRCQFDVGGGLDSIDLMAPAIWIPFSWWRIGNFRPILFEIKEDTWTQFYWAASTLWSVNQRMASLIEINFNWNI